MASGIELAHLPSGMFSSIINGQEILEEEYNEDFEPTEEEVKEYCDVLGLDPMKEGDLLYIAKEAIKAPLPPEWKPCKNEGTEEIYYFNFQTGESSWDHPCDKYYVELLERERVKKRNRERMTSKAKKNSHQHASSVKPLGPGTTKLQGAAELPALSKKGGLNPLHSLPPLRSGPPQLGPLKLPSGMMPPPQAVPISGEPSIARAMPVPPQINPGRQGPLLSAPTRPTLNPEKEIMKGISIEFEEEEDDDDDESDEELSDKELYGASAFRSSKFGNIMDAGDLGMNLTISDEDISDEIREIQEASSNNSDDDLQPHNIGKVAISPEAAALGSEQQVGIKRSQRPTTARGLRSIPKPQNFKENSDDDETESSGSLLRESRLLENVNLVDLGSDEVDTAMHTATTTGLFQQPHNLDLKPAGRQAVTSEMARPLGNTIQAKQQSQQSLNQQIAAVKQQHEEELATLRKTFDEELAKERDSLRAGQDIKITAYKNELSTHLGSEEKKLQAEHQSGLSQLKDKLKAAQEDEEARLQEEKSNFLRTLTQQIAREKQEAEDKMRKDLELQLSRLRSQLELDKGNEEKAAQKDLEELKKTLQVSRREELNSNETEFEQQLSDLNKSHQLKMEKAKQELEAEYAKMMEETKASLEAEHQKAISEISDQHQLNRATEEEKLQQQEAMGVMEKELETELAAKRTELQQQHQLQLDKLNLELKEKLINLQDSHQQQESELKQELADKLEQLKLQCEKDSNAELGSLQIKFDSAKQNLQVQIAQVEEELESKRTEAEQERLSVQQLLASIKSEKEAAEAQRLSVEEMKKELAKEEQHIQQLRNTTAAETDQLLAERQSELKDDIEQEQSILAELKKRREQLQREIDALTKDKSKLEATIEELKKQELSYRQELQTTQNQIKESKAVLAQISDELKTAQEHLKSVSKQAIVHDGNKEAPAASLLELAASQESEDTLRSNSEHSSTSMSVRELASPSPTTDEVMDEAVNKPVRVAWEEKCESTIQSNGLSQAQQRLIREAKQLKRAQDFLQKQKHCIKKRRADLMEAQKSWTTDHGRMPASLTSPDHRSIAQKVEKKFEKEAAAISNAEEQLMLTNRLLKMKEHRLTQLEDSVTSNVDSGSSSVDNWEPSLLSSKPYAAYGRDSREQFAHHHRLRTESPERRLPKSSLAMTTDSEDVLNSKQLLRRKRCKSSSSKQLSCDGERDSDDTTNSFDHAAVPSSEIMSSLNKINSQLGEVLTRLGHPSTTTTGTASSIQPYPSIDPLLQARRPDKTEEELRSKWQYYLGHVPQQTPSSSVYVPDVRGSPFGGNFVAPVDPAGLASGSMVRKSTSEMYKSQTDWLRTFQQEMSTYARPKLKTTPLKVANKNMSDNLNFPMQSRTPKFVLDSKNNIHFVHV